MSPGPDTHSLVPSQEAKEFKSFAVLDLETANLPQFNYNKVGVTELSVYGFAVEILEQQNQNEGNKLPKLPRVLNKISVCFNPRMAITPFAEEVTGFDNFMLENESTFNENAANTFLGFLKHLKQPVCLVAHNGFKFDFPIIKQVLEKVEVEMPKSVYCIDSLRAFHDIDQLRKKTTNSSDDEEVGPAEKVESLVSEIFEKFGKEFEAQAQNETTPKRPTISAAAAAKKRKRNHTSDECGDKNECDCRDLEHGPSKSKRALNFEDSNNPSTSTLNNEELNLSYQMALGKQWYPPRGMYKLGNMFKRIFSEDPNQQHYAEADVATLTHLMLYYGKDFTDYAQKHAIPFESIPHLGRNNL